MATLRIIVLSTLAAVVYGILHDQVTARICVEYFTVGHPRIIASQSPTLLGLAWGVVATWWVGLPLGGLLAVAAQSGSAPRLTARDLVKPIALLLLVMALGAVVAGVCGYALANTHRIALPAPWAAQLPATTQPRFMADWWAHNASYGVGMLGGIVLAALTYRRRVAQSGLTSG